MKWNIHTHTQELETVLEYFEVNIHIYLGTVVFKTRWVEDIDYCPIKLPWHTKLKHYWGGGRKEKCRTNEVMRAGLHGILDLQEVEEEESPAKLLGSFGFCISQIWILQKLSQHTLSLWIIKQQFS